MNDRLANQVAGIAGVLWIVLILVGFGVIAGFSPLITDSKAEVVDYFTTSDATQVHLGEYIEMLGFLFLAVFAARLWAIVRQAEGGSGWLSMLALCGAMLFIALSVAGIAPLMAGSYRAEHGGLEDDFYVLLNDVRTMLYWISLLFSALFIIPFGAVIAQTAVLPRWLGWTAIAVGVALMVGVIHPDLVDIANLASFLLGIWVLVAGVILFMRAGVYTTEAT